MSEQHRPVPGRRLSVGQLVTSDTHDPVFVRAVRGMTRRGLLRRAAMTAVATLAITAGQWAFAKPMLVAARSCDFCAGNCSPCVTCVNTCPSPTGACACGQYCCVCHDCEFTACSPEYSAVLVLSCEFPCGCQMYCGEPCP